MNLEVAPLAVVTAQPADAHRLFALERACFALDRISLRSYQRLLSRPSAKVLLVEDEGGGSAPLLGSLVLLFRRRATTARVYSLAVSAQARRRGLASLLLSAAEPTARAFGCSRLRAEIRRDNAASLAAFQKAGFSVIGTYEDYYSDGMDAVRVEKIIN